MTSCCRGLNNLQVVHRDDKLLNNLQLIHRDDKLLQRVEQPAGGSYR